MTTSAPMALDALLNQLEWVDALDPPLFAWLKASLECPAGELTECKLGYAAQFFSGRVTPTVGVPGACQADKAAPYNELKERLVTALRATKARMPQGDTYCISVETLKGLTEAALLKSRPCRGRSPCFSVSSPELSSHSKLIDDDVVFVA